MILIKTYTDYLNEISCISLFHDFNKNELKDLFGTSKSEIIKYEKGQVIHLKNEECRAIDAILIGKVAVQNIDEDGNILTVSVFSAYDVLGVNLIFSNRNFYPMIVVAASETIILRIERDFLIKLCQRNEKFMVKLLTAISNKTIILTDKINTIAQRRIRQRIIDFLKYEYQRQKSLKIELYISKRDLAERLGVQRTSLSRELNKMRKDGLIEYDASAITLKDTGFLT